jgi:hypothetical protein
MMKVMKRTLADPNPPRPPNWRLRIFSRSLRSSIRVSVGPGSVKVPCFPITSRALMIAALLDFDNETADYWILWQDLLEVALVQEASWFEPSG